MADILGQIQRGYALGEDISRRPQRNALADLALKTQQQALSAQQSQEQRAQDLAGMRKTEFDQSQSLEKMRILNQAGKALKSINPAQWDGAYASILTKLQDYGIDVNQLPQQTPTPDELDQFIASTEGFITNPSTMTASMRDFESRAKAAGIKPGTPEYEKAARIELRLDPGAGTFTAPERIAGTGTTELVGSSEGRIKQLETYGGEKGKEAAGFENFADQWEVNKGFIEDSFPDIAKILQSTPGSSLGNAVTAFTSRIIGGLETTDAQAEIQQFGAFLLQGVPFAPGSQSDKELQSRAKLVADQVEDPNITPETKTRILGRFVDYMDSKAKGQRGVSSRIMQNQQAQPEQKSIKRPPEVESDLWNYMTPEQQQTYINLGNK